MDYQNFDKILRRHDLQNDPAFENVEVEISPLPPMPGKPLGLYYPDPDQALKVRAGTIWVPPDADEETVLHELGHRYGDYYSGDLSETFAEQYRISYSPVRRSPVRQEAEDHTMRNVIIGTIITTLLIRIWKDRKKH